MKQGMYASQGEHIEVQDGGLEYIESINPRLLPSPQRPRERMIRLGPSALSDQELLAVLLNTGIRGKNVFQLAQNVLDRLDQEKDIPSVKELAQLTGLGESKAGAVVAMLELGRRRWGVGGLRIRHPSDIYHTIRHYADRRQEYFLCLSLNGAHEVLAVRIVTIGLVNRTIVHPREVFADPLLDRASAVCVAHNHPSGQLNPSSEDDETTYRLRDAADILGLQFLDHLIFSNAAYFSYRQTGKLER